MFTGIHQLFQQLRNQSVESLRTVVRSDMQPVGHSTHLVGVNQHIARLGTDNHIGPHTALVQPLDLRINGSGTHTARNER